MRKIDHDQFDDEQSRQLAEALAAALDVDTPKPSVSLRAALEEKLAQTEDPAMSEAHETEANNVSAKQPSPRRAGRWWPMLAVALCLAVATVGLAWYLNRDRGERVAYAPSADRDVGDRSIPDDAKYISTDGSAPRDYSEQASSGTRVLGTDNVTATNEGNTITTDSRDFTWQGRPLPSPPTTRASGDATPAPMVAPHATPPTSAPDPQDREKIRETIKELDRIKKLQLANRGQAADDVQQFRPQAKGGLLKQVEQDGFLLDGEGDDGGRRRFAEGRGNEEYAPIHENAFLPVTGETAISTFSIDVDTASYSNIRRYLRSGGLPPPDAVRIEELVNYFQYDYPQPKDKTPFSVNMELAGCPWNNKHQLLRVALKGREIDVEQRPAANLVFLLDVSGSMQSQDKLPLLKEAMKMLVGELREDDRVAIVTYAGRAGLALDTTYGANPIKIRDAIDALNAGGSTNGSAGIQLAYQLATGNYVDGGVNRVILATDGDLNVGITGDEDLVTLIKDKAASGVFLSVLGFGTGNLKDAKLEGLADNGNGVYAYIDNLKEARKVLVEQASGSLVTIAKDVKIQIEFNPAEVKSYRLLGYENRMLATEDFDDDAKDAGEIGAGHTVTALYELVPPGVEEEATEEKAEEAKPRPLKYQQTADGEPADVAKPEAKAPDVKLTEAAKSGELLTLALRYKEPEGFESTRIEFTLPAKAESFNRASPDFQFASSVALFGMLMRHSRYAGTGSFATVEEIAGSTIGKDPQGYRQEFVEMVRTADQLTGQRRP